MSSICDCNSSLVLDFHFPSVRTKLSEQVRRFPRAPPAWFNVPTKEYVGHGTPVCSLELCGFSRTISLLLHLLSGSKNSCVPSPPVVPRSPSSSSLEQWNRGWNGKTQIRMEPRVSRSQCATQNRFVPSWFPLACPFPFLFFFYFSLFCSKKEKMERTTAGVFPVATLFHL